MHFQELSAYLRAHGNIDAHAELARFREQTGSEDMDRFLAYLRQRELISSDTFRDLHGRGHIAVAAFRGVRQNGTLVLQEPAAETPTVLDPNLAHAGANAAQPSVSGERGLDAGGYQILGEIAKGAMGEVLVARDLELLRKVAYKRMLPHLVGNPGLSARFFGEVQITAQLDHPNIVPIHEIEIAPDGRLGYAMKLIQGKTLTKLIKQHREAALEDDGKDEATRLNQRIEWFLKVCDAMAYAHEKGVLHRDLKPDNIMIGRFNEVYVMDWGICRLLDSPDEAPDEAAVEVSNKQVYGQTSYGAIMGTPGYMSPEQAQGRVPELDRRSDVYALGLILFELVCLRPALMAKDMPALLARSAAGEKDKLFHVKPRIPIARELAAIIGKATEPDLAARYQSVDDMVEDIRRYLRGQAVAARPDSLVQAAARWLGRHKAVTLAIMGFLLLAGAAATIAMQYVKERQLEAARVHEQRTQEFLLEVSLRSHAIDSYFFGYEKNLARLAGQVRGALAASGPDERPVYLSQDFDAGPPAAPPDLAPSSFYGQSISTGFSVFQLAPGVDADAVRDQIRGLNRLTPALIEMLIESADEASDVSAMTGAQVRERIGERGVAALRAFVTLSSGVHMSYPGTGGYPAEYDGRLRPKYTLATGKRGILWGNPFPDRYGHGLILACSTAVYDAGGKLLGVTGIEMTFHWLIDNLLEIPDAPYVEATYLVDDRGRVVLSALAGKKASTADPSDAENRASDAELSNETVELDLLPYPEVRAALSAERSGHLDFSEHGATKLAVYYRLDALGWWYVVIADEAGLLRSRAHP